MVDMTSIASAASSLSSAGTILKTLLGMKTDNEVRSKIAELQNEIINAQSAALSGLAERARLIERIEALEGEIKAAKSWESEAGRYQLVEFSTGRQVYVLIPEKADGEPSHKLCPACFQKEKKSILQPITTRGDGEVASCAR